MAGMGMDFETLVGKEEKIAFCKNIKTKRKRKNRTTEEAAIMSTSYCYTRV
jgi:hypothetical protein